ncbi:ATP synthase F0 subunit C [Faecalicatena contorta]|uniref:ATP synthase subunit c n=1 Tax=Faecalicatena contorta TaxID=39482 RepID=A0A315ZNH9_9FIRM|nr:ATP synthase F0 subunit C [Faecalicatena contorta]PWJ47175.1 ATP synthase F0 subcomplex C subunit [Faecalicatena contorta]SUQ16150.1 ATP synthase F0 subcomplex C subunit [Faecalicatena contorta]
MEILGTVIAVAHIAAALALMNGLFTTFGQAKIAAQAIESIGRQPEAADSIRSVMFVGLAMAETSGIYGLLIAIIMLFANPLVNILINYIG